MKIYLVGGAVRDQLLGLPITEKDYVVVGSTPEKMLELGFKPVGADFPVFIHPTTHAEYALARTERKSGVGYAGFTFYTAPQVTLEQDLIRRDITINAMAMDDVGGLVDPYSGKRDLELKIIRHVSSAFAEDPLRVLRVARFAARFYPLGFTIAPETMQLMCRLVNSGELAFLTPERIWKETLRALLLPAARIYFETLKQCGALAVLFPEINALFGVPQRPEHHPEIDCGVHTLMSLDYACAQNFSAQIRWAALLHDLGKAATPAHILPKHIMHEHRGIPLVKAICTRLKVPRDFTDLALLVCQHHLLMHGVLSLKPTTLWKLLHHLDVLRKPERAMQFALACMCDARGRLGFENAPYPQYAYLQAAVNAVNTVKLDATAAGLAGTDIADYLTKKRIAVLATMQQTFK